MLTASWSSGRVQDSESGSRSSPGSNILPVHLLVPLSKALHTALLHSTQEQMGNCKGRFVSLVAKSRVSSCIPPPPPPPRDLRWISRWIYADWEEPKTKEGTCQRLQSRALSLDVNSKPPPPPPGIWDGYPDEYMRTGKNQRPRKVLVNVFRAELWAWMWTLNSDFTLCSNISVVNLPWTLLSLILYLLVQTLSMKVAIVVVSRVGLSIVGNKEFEYMASINFQLEDE